MLAFVITVIALTLLALAFFVPALYRKTTLEADTFDQQNIQIARTRLKELKQDLEAGTIDAQEYEQVRMDLEKTLAADLSVTSQTIAGTETGPAQNAKGLAMILLVLVPFLAVLTYAQLGEFDAISGKIAAQQVADSTGHDQSMSIEQAITQLSERLEQEPDNAEGWYMLGRSYMAVQRYNEAVSAYKKSVELFPGNADLLLSYADALAMSEGRRLSGKAYAVINQALSIQPDNLQGLWMAGMAASEMGDFKQALTHWYKLDPLLNDNIEGQTQLRGMISNVEKNMTPAEVAAVKAAAPATQPLADNGIGIKVNVSLDESLYEKVSVNDTLFIFAKAMQGPPMPLAAVRQLAGSLPVNVVLNDAMAMMPEMKLSKFETVKVAAIISKSGQAGMQPGDLFGEVASVDVNTKQTVNVVINQIK